MGQSIDERMDLGTRIWHPPWILQWRMTSLPTWQIAWDRDHRRTP